MKIWEKRERTVVVRAIVKRTCDLCGLESSVRYSDGTVPAEKWIGGWDVDETEIAVVIRHRDGADYPEGGCGTELEIDLCPGCVKEKLVPWLRSQGAEIAWQDWDR